MTFSILSEFREMVSEQAEYRELLYQITLRDLKLRYKQTIMGFGWAVFMPLLNTRVSAGFAPGGMPVDTKPVVAFQSTGRHWSSPPPVWSTVPRSFIAVRRL